MAARAERNTRTAPAYGGKDVARARRKLGLSPVIGRPIALITSQLAGGKAMFMEFARLAAQIEPGLAYVAESYDSLNPGLQAAVSIDEICAMHGIDPHHYVAVVGEAALRFRNNSAILIAALQFPDVVARTVKEALKPGGHKDRKLLFQHVGFIPTRQGPTISVSFLATTKAEASGDSEGEGLPSFEQDMREDDKITEDQE